MFVFPLIATLVSMVFSGLVFRQYLNKRRPYQLAWSIALLMFGAASLAETAGVLSGWNEALVKTWYLFGAVLVVGYLALGSLYIHDSTTASRLTVIGVFIALISVLPMVIFSKDPVAGSQKMQAALLYGAVFVELGLAAVLAKERIAAVWLVNLFVGSLGGLLLTVSAPVDAAQVANGWEAIQRSVFLKGLAVSINTIGGTILVGGALYSGWTLFRKQIMRERAIGTILIGAGALLPSIGGFAHGYFKIAEAAVLSVSLTLGIIVMFLGFLETGRPSSPPPAKPEEVTQTQAGSTA